MELLHESSVDVTTFKVHSGWAAASLKAALIGLSLSVTGRAEEWSNLEHLALF